MTPSEETESTPQPEAAGPIRIKFNENSAMNAIWNAVKERGENYVYEKPDGASCFNWFAGEPGCIVGYAFHSAGVPGSVMERCSDGDVIALITQLNSEPDIDLEITNIALEIFRIAQTAQDDGTSWGDIANILNPVSCAFYALGVREELWES